MIAISVVIPVYNAEKFLRKAVASALQQPEVAEVLLVEDCSPDNCLAICRELAQADGRLKVLQHPGGENRGAAASRNLGIFKSTSPYIAFLDADDYYLPFRFKRASELLQADPMVDGVYDAIGLHIHSEQGRARYETYKGKRMDPEKLITVNRGVSSDQLFEALVLDNIGIFHANGITVKRELILKAGLFDEDLNIVEDVVLWLKLAYHGKLVAGNLTTPVARQGIHDWNREPETQPILLYQKYQRLLDYFCQQPVRSNIIRLFFTRMIAYHPARKFGGRNAMLKKTEFAWLMLLELITKPSLLPKIIKVNF